MKQRLIILLSLACSALPALAQQPAPKPKDVASVDAIIAAVYDANSVMVDQKRGTERFRSLFVPDARLNSTQPLPGTHGARLKTWTLDEYVKLAAGGQPRHGFSEREVARTTEAFGHVVQVFSTYASYRDSTDKAPIRGINSFQLFNDGTRWWVVNVLWDDERFGGPIPVAYEPKRRI